MLHEELDAILARITWVKKRDVFEMSRADFTLLIGLARGMVQEQTLMAYARIVQEDPERGRELFKNRRTDFKTETVGLVRNK